jgi:hypothetical protein
MTSPLALRSGSGGRLIGAALALLLLGSVAWPSVAEAQGGVDPKRLEYKWQLLEYRDDGELTPVPPGTGLRSRLAGHRRCLLPGPGEREDLAAQRRLPGRVACLPSADPDPAR